MGAINGRRINMVMSFTAVNGWFALALVQMGARVKWASNDRNAMKLDDISIA